jgi:hypothetical protein
MIVTKGDLGPTGTRGSGLGEEGSNSSMQRSGLRPRGPGTRVTG